MFPELHLTGYTLGERAVELAETTGGPYVSRVCALARAHHIAVMMGHAELDASGGHAYNAVFLTDSAGNVLGSYHKIHLYGKENGWLAPGTRAEVFDSEQGCLGPMICYDVEFPELSRILALQGAEWLAIPTANFRPFEHEQEILLQARAMENRSIARGQRSPGGPQAASVSAAGGRLIAQRPSQSS